MRTQSTIDWRGPQRGYAARPACAHAGPGPQRPQPGAAPRRGRASLLPGGGLAATLAPLGISRPFRARFARGQKARPPRFAWIAAAAFAAALCLPAAAQAAGQGSSGSSTAATTQAQPHAPLKENLHQGFWGRLNPFARKKYVQNQLSPIRDRVNELDGLTADNANAVAKVDARNKAELAAAADRARQANATADAAQQQVQQEAQQASQLSGQVASANTRLEGVDQYRVAQRAELHFRPGPARLNADTQQQLDTFFEGLAAQKGYVVEVTAYSSRRGAAGIAQSQQLADAVVRHLVLENNIPLYRIYTMGMGDMRPAAAEATAAGPVRRTAGGTVEIKILRNSLSQ